MLTSTTLRVEWKTLRGIEQSIAELKAGTAKEEPVTFGPYLNRNFISGDAIITWNKADAERFRTE